MQIQPYTPTTTWHLKAAALTDRGQERSVNEDAVFQFSDYTKRGESIGLYIVCDGMGGHEAGEVASQLVVQTMVTALSDLTVVLENDNDVEFLQTRPSTNKFLTEWLRDTILEANEKIRDLIDTETIRSMGTTVNAVLIYNGCAFIANVGDSRTYMWRAGELCQLTSDHSLANEMAKLEAIPPEDVSSNHMRNILTRSVSGNSSLRVDIFVRPLQSEDRFLLCSDGLWLAFPDQKDLKMPLANANHPGDLCWKLVTEAKRRDGSDNISAVAVFVEDS
jgi:protein phosphatase